MIEALAGQESVPSSCFFGRLPTRVTTTTATMPTAKPSAVNGVKDSPNISAPQTAVTGAIKNIRVLTDVMPMRRSNNQYSP